MSLINKPTEEEIIRNSIPNRLYNHEFEKGRYFSVVHQDNDGFQIRLASRTMLKVLYIKEKDDIVSFEIIKVVDGKEKQNVNLTKFNFAQLRAFLSFISEIDLKGISQKRLNLSADDNNLDTDTIKTIKTLLSKEGGAEIIETLINEGVISSKDIVNTSFRKRGLQIFKDLLNRKDYWKIYSEENGLTTKSEEKTWQYFFKRMNGFWDMVQIIDTKKSYREKQVFLMSNFS